MKDVLFSLNMLPFFTSAFLYSPMRRNAYFICNFNPNMGVGMCVCVCVCGGGRVVLPHLILWNFWLSRQSFINKNCHNSRTSHDSNMKFRPVTKPHRRTTATSKKFVNNGISANGDVIVFFQYIANLQPSGSRILDAWSINLHFH